MRHEMQHDIGHDIEHDIEHDGHDMGHDMGKHSLWWKTTCCGAALLALGCFVSPGPAHAQFGGIVGGLIGGGLRLNFGGGGGSRHSRSSRHENGDEFELGQLELERFAERQRPQ